MSKNLTLLLIIALATSALADKDVDVQIRAGKIVALETPQQVVLKRIVNKKAVEQAAPEGKKFVVVTVSLSEGRSVGLHDFVLRSEGTGKNFTASALKIGDKDFDYSIWEAYAEGKVSVNYTSRMADQEGKVLINPGAQVKILYEVADSESGSFELLQALARDMQKQKYEVTQLLNFN